MAAFPEDFEIDISRLIMLWVAEGFLKPCNKFKCLEDVGKVYLEDLVNRNLILVSKKGPDGKLVAVGIHDLLRKICITKAEEEGFLHHFSSKTNVCHDAIENPKRRLGAHCTETFQELHTQDSSLRSIFSERGLFSQLSLKFRRLRILNSPKVTWWNLPVVISTFVNLRYISVSLDDNMPCLNEFLASLSKLPNLETIITDVTYCEGLQVPNEILRMPKLRHLIMSHPRCLSDPSVIGIINTSDLRTLERVIGFFFTEDVIKILVNLKKLTVVVDHYGDNWDDLNLDNVFHLQNLEELRVSRDIKDNDINRESEWTTIEDQFLRLKYFCSSLDYWVKWEVEKEHLPSLESLILVYVKLIDAISSGIGEIDSLQLIELQDCRGSLVNSARRIQEQQHENGNVAFQVNVVEYVYTND
ncbi:putative late blight resistance protein homolog R1C-3 isoform X2 [Henckelia pumila]|uniref:putative late blight resistance protein homolog R1C-3 isoform X2 n=1 Tax=Henckelia pumila TaxID=405737 RepID=UPI003C6E5BF0